MPTISNSAQFNLDTLQLIFGDTTDYGALGITGSNVKGNLTATGPSGIFHNGISWTSPDILISTNTQVIVPLPNTGGIVLAGTYTFDYTARIASSFTLNKAVPSTSTFKILGDHASLFPALKVFTITGGLNAGTYSVSVNANFDGTATVIIVNEVISSSNEAGSTVNVTNDYTNSLTGYISDCQPVASLELEADCKCTSITSMDLTNYTVGINGNFYAPTSLARTHIVNSPISPSTGQSVAGTTTSSDATIIVSPLWTGTWISTISTIVTYTIGSFTVYKTVTGSAKEDVECSDALCCAFQCIKNISDTYNDFKNSNPVQAQIWERRVIEVSIQWVIYSVAIQCGRDEDADNAIKSIINLTKAAGCNCCNDNSAEPALVIGICGAISTNGSGGNVHVTSCGNGIIVTPTVVGNTTTYQVCLDRDIIGGIIATYLETHPLNFSQLGDVLFTSLGSGDLVRFNGVHWVNVSSISINQITEVISTNPTVGQVLQWNGTHYVNANNTGTIIEISNATYTNSGTPTQTLHSVNLDTNVFSKNGDFIRVQSEWLVSGDVNAKEVIFAIGGLDFPVDALNYKNIRRVLFNFDIIRVNSTDVRIRKSYSTYGDVTGIGYPQLTPEIFYTDPLTYLVNNMDTLANTLAFRCNPTGGGSTITLFDYTVLSFKG